MLRRLLAPVAIAITALATAACTQGSPAADTKTDAKNLSIAFLMPCSTCADRFESKDKPYFEDAVKQLDPSIKVIANNAQGDAAVQLQQAESALTNGAKVIVVSPFTAETGASIVAKADAAGAKVVAYDGAIEGAVPAAYVSFQNEKVGELQGQFLLDKLPHGATVAMINGDITSAPGRDFKAGAHKILDPAFADGRLKLGYESDTPSFDPAKGQAEMEQGLTKLNDRVQGVIAPNDGLANAVITALTARKLNGKVLVTGQDATDPGLAAIIAGNQSMTVYKSIRDEAGAAAKIAVALAKGDSAGAASLTTTTVDNGSGQVPALLLDPVAVTRDNIADVVIKDGYTTKDKICVGEAAAKCNL
jgi:D-xylose transport system substrate-binding protein